MHKRIVFTSWENHHDKYMHHIFFHLFINVSMSKIMVNDMLHFILKPLWINIHR